MSQYKKRSWIQKKLLKFQEIEEYQNYRFTEELRKIKDWPALDVQKKDVYSFKHSGNAGDLIYSLATIKTLSKDGLANIFLRLNQPGRYGKKSHPLGNVMLNEKMFDMLKPLLSSQPFIKDLQIFNVTQQIDYNLDLFRDFPIKLASGDIARWYFYLYGINADLSVPWIEATPSLDMKDYIVVARSQRYRQPLVDYSFLKQYNKLVFVGVEAEYNDMKKMIPSIEFIKVKDFLELASIIAGCRFFIGNQSFPFALAEALKVMRVLEVYHLCPNVVVEGSKGFDFCYQPQFEKIINNLIENTQP